MSQQEMDQMDREVMALVNERQTEQEIATEPADPRNDTGDEGKQMTTADAQPCNDVEENTVTPAEQDGGAADQRAKGIDWRKQLQEKDGMYCIRKEEFNILNARARKTRNIRNSAYLAVCVAVMGALILVFCRPELLNYIVAAGVVSCSVMIGVCLERLVEENR